MRKTCEYEGCVEPVHGQGLCNTHHRRLLRHGDPSVVKASGPGNRVEAEPLFTFICEYYDEQGKAPTQREIADYFDCNPGTVRRRLRDLEWCGYIKLEYPKQRGIRIVESPSALEGTQ